MANTEIEPRTVPAKDEESSYEKNKLSTFMHMKSRSEDAYKLKWSQWAKNMRQVNGEFESSEVKRSRMRNRTKIYYRKTWSTNWRLLASFYQAFLKDRESLKVEGRFGEDVKRGKIITEMLKYRLDIMYMKNNLFRKFIWSLLDILNLSDTVVVIRWDTKTDSPDLLSYSPDNVFPDPEATGEHNMEYVILQSFRSEKYLRENDLWTEGLKPAPETESVLKAARKEKSNIQKPTLSEDSNYYPPDGSGEQGVNRIKHLYEIWETLEMKEGFIHRTITNAHNKILKDTIKTPFKIYNVVFGSCLLMAHQFFGESFPEALSGPQESINSTLNMRKDAVAQSLAPHKIVSRYGGVDLESLMNRRIGGITQVDDIEAVKEEQMRDVTGAAFAEASADDAMMQEMNGVTAQRLGMDNQPGQKATVANINYQESGTKLDLFTGIVAETFFKKVYFLLAYMIMMFETDETVFRVANGKLKEEDPEHKDIYDIENIVADLFVTVGTPSINKNMEINNAMLAMDKATMANQTTMALMQAGVDPGKLTIFNVAAFMVNDLLPQIGFKNVSDYQVSLSGTTPNEESGQLPNLAGAVQPQNSGGNGDISGV